MRTLRVVYALIVSSAVAQPRYHSKAPKDRPVPYSETLNRAAQPYVAQARRTYPAAKQRFLAGLPPKCIFSVTTKLRDRQRKRIEVVFVDVDHIKDWRVYGSLATHTTSVTKYQHGDRISFRESEVLDWTIVRPDGTGEGKRCR